jgi:hypothetical protein
MGIRDDGSACKGSEEQCGTRGQSRWITKDRCYGPAKKERLLCKIVRTLTGDHKDRKYFSAGKRAIGKNANDPVPMACLRMTLSRDQCDDSIDTHFDAFIQQLF